MPNNQQVIDKIAEKASFKWQESALLIGMLKDKYSHLVGGGTEQTNRIRRSMFSSASHDGQDSSSSENLQDEGSVTLGVNFEKHQKVPVTENEMKYSISDFQRQIIDPAIRQLSSEAELFAHTYVAQNAGGKVGIAGTAPTSVGILNDVAKRFDKYGVPTDKRLSILSPDMKYAILPDLQQKEVSEVLPAALRDGKIGNISGISHYMHNINYAHKTGNYGGTPLVNGTLQTTSWTLARDTYVSTVNTDGWTSGATLKKGDIISIDGVNAVHPQTKADLGIKQHFTVIADAVAGAGGDMAIIVTPPLIAVNNTGNSANYMTVASAPADNAPITVESGAADTTFGANSLAFHPEALAFRSDPLARPPKNVGGQVAFSTKNKGSLPITCMMYYDPLTKKTYAEFHMRFALAVVEPRAVIQILG